MTDMADMESLLNVMARLRDPEDGCPWDLEQTFASLVPYTLEEAYEVADAVEREDWAHLPDELGDLLLQVVFYAQIGREAGGFDFRTVVSRIHDKLVRRHPHVFGDAEVTTAEEQSRAWEAQKAAERGGDSALDDIPRSLPALQRAGKIQGRAVKAGFEWPRDEDVFAKVDEELDELRREVDGAGAQDRRRHEVGDLLFAAVGLAHRLGVDPESALRGANERFEERFRHMEAALGARGGAMAEQDPGTLQDLWQAAKDDGAGA
jgi:ATP diphosphatase